MQKRIMLFAHGGSLNRGCEAIVRTTAAMLQRELECGDITVASMNLQDDLPVHMPGSIHFIHHRYPAYSVPWFGFAVANKILHQKDLAYAIQHRPAIAAARDADICLSIGGDNYCYGKHAYLYSIDFRIKKMGKKLVLWGCSIERDLVDRAMRDDLEKFDVITTRESISLKTLQEQGLGDKTFLHPDPAFTLATELSPLPVNWVEGNTVGINISPMILSYEQTPGIALESARALVEHILKTTDSAVALIPHVTWPRNNDLEPLSRLKEEFSDSGRVLLIGEGYNALQTKGFISRCRLFVGARTHATIAAYSTGVPTLVVGYSVKAKGIARDLFGDDTGLLLPVQQLQDRNQLISAFDGLREREGELRSRLQQIMPGYIASAAEAATRLRGL